MISTPSLTSKVIGFLPYATDEQLARILELVRLECELRGYRIARQFGIHVSDWNPRAPVIRSENCSRV